MWILVVVFVVTLFMGIPISFSLGISGLIGILATTDVNAFLVLGEKAFRSLDSFPLMAIPFFILAGELMGYSITTRLFNLASAIVGHIRGGLSQVTVLSSFFFGGVTGVGVAETAAIGSVVIPAMEKKGYPKSFAASLVAASSTLGPIVPPSVPMIIYALSVGGGVSISALFLAGVIPAVMIALAFMMLSYFIAIRKGHPKEHLKFNWQYLIRSLREAVWALLLPVIIIGGLVSGIFTATETSVVAVVYALLIGFFVHRDLKCKNIPEHCVNAGIVTAIVLMLMAFARVFSWVLTIANLPTFLGKIITGVTQEPLMFMLLVALLLLIVGLFIESSAAIIMLAPVLAPIAMLYDIDPTLFGFTMVMNLMLGMITPPVGIILFIASGLAKISIEDVVKNIWPYILVAYSVLVLLILFPPMVLFIPNLFGF